MALITVQDLSPGYDAHAVVENLNFSVNAGDYLCIVGENGSGKTTLMKTLLGLQEPVGGRILIGDGLMKNEIGYLPQQTIVQKDFPASVREI
ncbi:MAG: ATP-binding cassette domain-containing protein, partial [Lachnospiraceae bacterium]|nr:ATP-binding cassette domain-containing protein [Lachnospiraceae bacterium]